MILKKSFVKQNIQLKDENNKKLEVCLKIKNNLYL